MSSIQPSSTSNYILALPSWYPNIQDPADGNFIEKHLEAIAGNNKVITLYVKGIANYRGVERQVEVKGNLTVVRCYFNRKKGPIGKIQNLRRYMQLQEKMWKVILEKYGKPKLCHVHVIGRSSLLAIKLKDKLGIPFVVSEHWGGYYPESGKMTFLKRRLIRQVMKKANGVSAVSQSLARAMMRIGRMKDIEVIPNIVDQVFFTTEIISSEDTSINILHISNMIPLKRVDGIINAADALAKLYPDLNLTLIGEGPMRFKLESLATTKKNLTGTYKFTGDIDKAEIAKLFREASFTVMNSKFETQSVVLLESIAMGVPVVAPNVAAIPEHFSDKGILFDPLEKDALFKAMTQMIQRRNEFNGDELRAYAKAYFSSDSIIEKFNRFYQSVLN